MKSHPVAQRGAASRLYPWGRELSRIAWGLCLAVAVATASGQPRLGSVDPALLTDLLQWAGRLSALPDPPAMPGIRALPVAELRRRVCPERPGDCRTLVAVYDTDERQVLYVDTLDLEDLADQSFIVHEMVHYLQHLRDGDRLFAGCVQVMAAETQAYEVQNKYLAHFKQWRRAGEMLRFMHCQQAGADPEYRPDQPAVLTGRSPQGH